jgi:hypothetical protein
LSGRGKVDWGWRLKLGCMTGSYGPYPPEPAPSKLRKIVVKLDHVVSYESVQARCKNGGGQTVHKYGARLRTMKTVLFPVFGVEYCCPPGPLFGQNVDHMHERDNARAILSDSSAVEMESKWVRNQSII